MLPAVASADTVTVNTTADHNDKSCNETTPGDCTLREAVELATNESGKPITAINLPKGHYTLTLGELQLANDHIIGAGARASIIDGNNTSRVLVTSGDVQSSIEGVTVTGGNGTGSTQPRVRGRDLRAQRDLSADHREHHR